MLGTINLCYRTDDIDNWQGHLFFFKYVFQILKEEAWRRMCNARISTGVSGAYLWLGRPKMLRAWGGDGGGVSEVVQKKIRKFLISLKARLRKSDFLSIIKRYFYVFVKVNSMVPMTVIQFILQRCYNKLIIQHRQPR